MNLANSTIRLLLCGFDQICFFESKHHSLHLYGLPRVYFLEKIVLSKIPPFFFWGMIIRNFDKSRFTSILWIGFTYLVLIKLVLLKKERGKKFPPCPFEAWLSVNWWENVYFNSVNSLHLYGIDKACFLEKRAWSKNPPPVILRHKNLYQVESTISF